MKRFVKKISWSIISFITTGIFTTGSVLAHPGHIIEEQVHGFLHGEHLLVLLAIVAAFVVNRFIKKFF